MQVASPFQPRVFAVDIESTGVDARRDKILELALIEVNAGFTEIGRCVWRFDPGRAIPEAATAVHGITNQDVADCPRFSALAPRIQRLLAGSTVIAYNGRRFDVPLLHRELVEAGQEGISPSIEVIDPYQIYLRDSPRKLSDACRFYGVSPPTRAHAALDDTLAMLDVMRCQFNHALRAGMEPSISALASTEVILDSAGWFFRRRGDGPIRLARGRLRGAIAALHPGYVAWIAQQNTPPDTRALCRQLAIQVAA